MRKQILQNAIDHVLFQAKAAHQVRAPGWSNWETQIAFADFLFDTNDLPELARDLQDESADHLAEEVAHEFDRLGCDGAFNLRKLMFSRVDWKQLATRLLEWAGVQVPARPEGGSP
jgi:hypothetical protein